MKKINNRIGYLITLLMLQCMNGICQINEYKYKREVIGVHQPWHRFTLPEALFSEVRNDLGDIRIYGINAKADTMEIPYLLKIGNPDTVCTDVAFKLVNTSKGENGYYFSFETTQPVTINQIKLHFKEENFDWRLDLKGSQDLEQWYTILEDQRIISIKNKQTDWQLTKLFFPDSKYKYYRIFVDSNTKPQLIGAALTMNQIQPGRYQSQEIVNKKISQDKINKQTIVLLQLKKIVPVSNLYIEVAPGQDFYRSFSLYYLLDSIKTSKGWIPNYQLGTEGVLNSVYENIFQLPNVRTNQLKIIIENHDNLPLKLNDFKIRSYVHEIIGRYDVAKKYYLVYGNSKKALPSYDINHFRNKIPTEIEEVKLGTADLIEKNATYQTAPLFSDKKWLWSVIAVVAGLMMWFSIKMLREVK